MVETEDTLESGDTTGLLPENHHIEDAPEHTDLNELLDDTKEIDLTNKSLNSGYPHFKVEVSKLEVALNVVLNIILTKNVYSKAVGLKANARTNTLRVYSSNFKHFFSYDIPLFRMGENDTVCEKFFAISYLVLKKLVTMRKREGYVLVYEKDDEFYFKALEIDVGGDFVLETMGATEDLLTCKDKPSEEYKNIDTGMLNCVLGALYPYVRSAPDPRQKRVYVANNVFYAQYMPSCARVNSIQDIPDMDLTNKDIKILLAIMDEVKDTQIVIKKVGQRFFFEGENFVFTTILDGETISPELFDGFDNLIFTPNNHSASVFIYRISGVVDMSKYVPYPYQRLQFNFDSYNNLLATMPTKRSPCVFTIGDVNPDVVVSPLGTPVDVSPTPLDAMLKIFENYNKVGFYLTPQGIGMKRSVVIGKHKINLESVLYTEAGITEIKNTKKQNQDDISDSSTVKGQNLLMIGLEKS